jgi:hypothetical protein
VRFFICGSALSGQPDNKNLGGATLIGPARTAARYRLHSVKDGWHPGIYEVAEGGISIPGEVYDLSDEQYTRLMAGEPPDMYEAPIAMEDGSTVSAMFFPRDIIEERGYEDISHFGGWAAYKAATK